MTEIKSEEKFRVLLAEDDEHWQRIVKDMVEDIGGTLVLTVSTLETAMAAIQLLENLKIDLVILGGNLGEWAEGNPDAVAMLEAIGKQSREVKTIGLSGDEIRDVDVDLGKRNAVDLEKTILELLAE